MRHPAPDGASPTKYKDKGVRFVGVDVWEQDTSLVEPFLKEMGDKMDYDVAASTASPHRAIPMMA